MKTHKYPVEWMKDPIRVTEKKSLILSSEYKGKLILPKEILGFNVTQVLNSYRIYSITW